MDSSEFFFTLRYYKVRIMGEYIAILLCKLFSGYDQCEGFLFVTRKNQSRQYFMNYHFVCLKKSKYFSVIMTFFKGNLCSMKFPLLVACAQEL